MIGQSSFKFYNKATSPREPDESYRNVAADNIVIQISGDFAEGSFIFEGKTDLENGDWSPIAGLDLSDATMTSAPTKKGIYEIGIEGVQIFRVRIVSISGGSATVFGRVIKTGV